MSSPLKKLAAAFLRLGLTAFGGPAVHVAMMEDEFVRKRKWLTREEFLDMLGAANLIPGPSSSELAIYIGQRRAGWRGLIVAGTCFIFPAAMLVTAIAWAYVRYSSLPQVDRLLYGIKPVMIAIVLQAIAGLGRTAIKTPFLTVLAAAVLTLGALGAPVVPLLFGAGALSLLWRMRPASPLAVAPLPLVFLYFIKVGALQFGSGYMLLAFFQADLVHHLHWLTERQLLDAVAVGQLTPGPLFTTGTFIGYLLGGVPGAILATIGIFLPAFFLVALGGRYLPGLRKSRAAGAFLDGVNAASVALMAWVTVILTKAAVVDALSLAIALASALLLLRFKVSSQWLVLGGAAAGLLRVLA